MKHPSPKPLNADEHAADSELRKHYYLDEYVVIAPKRNLRPDSFSHGAESHKVANPSCHFCNNTEPALFASPGPKNWDVRVIQNAYPALSLNNPKAFGRQEVVINTPDHDKELSELPLEHILEIFAAYRHRLMSLKEEAGIRYVLVFKNDGPVAGASVAHAHCQIYALPIIPPMIERESDALNHYWDEHNTCALCDMLTWETKKQVRIIYADKHLLAVAPYASQMPFEAWIVPRRHFGQFSDFNHGESTSLAVILKKLTARLDTASISFNYFLQESIPHQDHHFMLRLLPRTTKWAGAEYGTGVIINPVPPEYSVLWYQNKV